MKFFKYLIIIVVIIAVPIFGTAQDHTDWSYNLSIYEVNVRQYTKEGTFAAFGTHLDRLKNLGVGIIWFMPIHPIGMKNRLGSLGSYYSVKDYLNINPEFGTLPEFTALVDSIHSKGMYVVLDWVGNHTSWDNVLTQTHPEWYKKNSSGDFIPPPGTNWTDVIQLDYNNPALRMYMIEAMKFWITETKIDGFRCDAVSFVPISFWTEAIAELKKTNPEIFMIAEDNGAQYYTSGFDMTYAWNFYGFGYGLLKDLASGAKGANELHNYALSEQTLFPGQKYRMYFTSNHDENSWYGTDVELFGTAAEQFNVLSLTLRSVPLIYGGQEAGLNHRLKFFDKDEIIWQTHPMQGKYSILLDLKKKNSALWNGAKGGEPIRISTTNDQTIFAFTRQYEKDKIFALFNLSNQEKVFTIIGNGYIGIYNDVFKGTSVSVTANYQMTLPARGYTILKKEETSNGISETEHQPQTFFLFQNHPNPFNPSTTIRFGLPTTSRVSIKIFNTLGQQVSELINNVESSGWHEIVWKANAASGLYFYRIDAVSNSDPNLRFTQFKKMLLLK